MVSANQRRRDCEFHLRPYRGDDFEAIYALDGVCFGPKFRFSRAMMRKVVGARNAVLQVAYEADEEGPGTIVGFCAGSVENRGGLRVGYLATLGVAPSSQGRGLGRAMLLATERDLAELSVTAMRLHVFAGNPPAIRLYEAEGYQFISRKTDFYGSGDDALVYGKVLPAPAQVLGS